MATLLDDAGFTAEQRAQLASMHSFFRVRPGCPAAYH